MCNFSCHVGEFINGVVVFANKSKVYGVKSKFSNFKCKSKQPQILRVYFAIYPYLDL